MQNNINLKNNVSKIFLLKIKDFLIINYNYFNYEKIQPFIYGCKISTITQWP